MVRVDSQQLLNKGIYTPAEAGLYARVHTATIARWIHGSRSGHPVVHAQLGEDPTRIVTFLDFVQALAIRAIRQQFRVPLQKIRDAVSAARNDYGVEFPFAARHKTYLFDNDIVIQVRDEELVRVTGAHRRQHLIREVAELYMSDLTFGSDGLADAYVAFERREQQVVMNPRLHFGEPVVASCGYSARALIEAYTSEGSVAGAAASYGVSNHDVELAIAYFDFLQEPVAA